MTEMEQGRRWNKFVNIAILGTLAVLLLNPSGVVGRWMIAEYKGWHEQRRIALNWEKLASAKSYLGPPLAHGRGAIVEFVSYDCPVCQTIAPSVLEAARNRGVTVVVRHVPSDRGGPAATEAALAAICAEQYDRFPEAHDALISDRTWLSTRDWLGLGVHLGVSDPESFGSCVGEEAAQLRLAQDRVLADELKIQGTPTFVSVEGLHLGPPGLASALAFASHASRVVASEDQTPLRPATGSFFDSSEYPDLSELLRVTAGFFLPDSGLALVDPTEIFIVNLASKKTLRVGGEGRGPKEFGHISWAFRTPQGVAVWDRLRTRVVVIARDGKFLRSQGYLDVPFYGFMSMRPMAARPDGSIVFRDRSKKPKGFTGRVRDPVQFKAVRRDGSLKVVLEVLGGERYYAEDESSASVIFGHLMLEAAAGDRFVVADTDRGAIAVFDWNGNEVNSIPMPTAGVRPSSDQLRMARETRAAEFDGLVEQVKEMWAGSIPSQYSEEDDPTFSQDWPANEVAPAIDAVLTDVDQRLWVRDYHLPGQDSVTWRVWDIERARLLFTARLGGEDTLLDARGDVVLLRRLDAFDVPRAVVSRLRAGPE